MTMPVQREPRFHFPADRVTRPAGELRKVTVLPVTSRESLPRARSLVTAEIADSLVRELDIPEQVQFHVLSFEGPDPYSRIGGLETRVAGLCQSLVAEGRPTHLWFVGDAERPAHELRDGLRLHRWCQWLSRHHPIGAYDGEWAKVPDYARTLPPHLVDEHIAPHLAQGGAAVILAEEWQTVDAVLHLDHLLRARGLRERVRILWNANNVFGFERIDWERLRQAAIITTVSRYMKQLMQAHGVDAIAIPNGLSPEAYEAPSRSAVADLRKSLGSRLTLTKMARWDPDKRWLGAIDVVVKLRNLGAKPLLIARGGREPYGREVLQRMRDAGLRVVDRACDGDGARGVVRALSAVEDADVVQLTTHVDQGAKKALFRASDIVLANSEREPFGLVGLEAMAAGGIACTGCSGEDYAMAGRNALVLQTADPEEFVSLYRMLRDDAGYQRDLRRAGKATAKQFAWREVIRSSLLPRLDLSSLLAS